MNTINKWPDWANDIWAKSPGYGQQTGESLALHTWEVLSRLRDLVRLRPGLPKLCGFPSLWHVLFGAAFFHDWGKVALSFQAMLRGQGKWRHRHEVLSLIFIDWIAEVLTEEETIALVATIITHHKDAEQLFSLYPLGLAPEDDPLTDLINELNEKHISLCGGGCRK